MLGISCNLEPNQTPDLMPENRKPTRPRRKPAAAATVLRAMGSRHALARCPAGGSEVEFLAVTPSKHIYQPHLGPNRLNPTLRTESGIDSTSRNVVSSIGLSQGHTTTTHNYYMHMFPSFEAQPTSLLEILEFAARHD